MLIHCLQIVESFGLFLTCAMTICDFYGQAGAIPQYIDTYGAFGETDKDFVRMRVFLLHTDDTGDQNQKYFGKNICIDHFGNLFFQNHHFRVDNVF